MGRARQRCALPRPPVVRRPRPGQVPESLAEAEGDELDHRGMGAEDVGDARGRSRLRAGARGEVPRCQEVRRDRVVGRHDVGRPRLGAGQRGGGDRAAPTRGPAAARRRRGRARRAGPATRPPPAPPADPATRPPHGGRRPGPARGAGAAPAGRRGAPARARSPAQPAGRGGRGSRWRAAAGPRPWASDDPASTVASEGAHSSTYDATAGHAQATARESGEPAGHGVARRRPGSVRDGHQPHERGTASR